MAARRQDKKVQRAAGQQAEVGVLICEHEPASSSLSELLGARCKNFNILAGTERAIACGLLTLQWGGVLYHSTLLTI